MLKQVSTTHHNYNHHHHPPRTTHFPNHPPVCLPPPPAPASLVGVRKAHRPPTHATWPAPRTHLLSVARPHHGAAGRIACGSRAHAAQAGLPWGPLLRLLGDSRPGARRRRAVHRDVAGCLGRLLTSAGLLVRAPPAPLETCGIQRCRLALRSAKPSARRPTCRWDGARMPLRLAPKPAAAHAPPARPAHTSPGCGRPALCLRAACAPLARHTRVERRRRCLRGSSLAPDVGVAAEWQRCGGMWSVRLVRRAEAWQSQVGKQPFEHRERRLLDTRGGHVVARPPIRATRWLLWAKFGPASATTWQASAKCVCQLRQNAARVRPELGRSSAPGALA